MKKIQLISFAIAAACAFSACTAGDHAASGGAPDTTHNTYDVTSNRDTAAVTHATGEATNVENAGNGGSVIAKDTTKIKVRSVTITPSATPAATTAAAPADTTKAAAKK